MPEILRTKNLTRDIVLWKDLPSEEVQTINITSQWTFTGVLILSTLADKVDSLIEKSYHCLEEEGDEEWAEQDFADHAVQEIESQFL